VSAGVFSCPVERQGAVEAARFNAQRACGRLALRVGRVFSAIAYPKGKFQVEMAKQSEQAKQLVNYYVDQLAGWSHITTRPLFGAVGALP
jgi:hypothetical protein